MDNYILTCFHHGVCVVGNPNPTYQREVDVFGVGIDKDHFSLVEFLSYTKDLRYTNVKEFYCEDNNELVQVTSDTQLLEFVEDLVDGDEFHVYVVQEVDELEKLPAPIGLLPWSGHVDESVDLPSSDTNVDAIPDEDDSDVDEELRSLRVERRNKRNHNLIKKRDRGKKTITEEVPIDAEAVGGVDLPGRRKSKKVRYDDECIVAIFELGMIFENAKEFRKALAKYAVEKNYQIKLRPNEAHRVRAKCKFKEKCKWLCYGAIDRDSL
ncbi:hypothetical protein RDI58_014695 [Solanum bulbocastanum]|uniref:Transposase MuDR plant domain-containing protein n=1 Tax=Solanum bulbocastanum TaxID=147425 RepID=A0AAN8TE52_SOLBU